MPEKMTTADELQRISSSFTGLPACVGYALWGNSVLPGTSPPDFDGTFPVCRVLQMKNSLDANGKGHMVFRSENLTRLLKHLRDKAGSPASLTDIALSDFRMDKGRDTVTIPLHFKVRWELTLTSSGVADS